MKYKLLLAVCLFIGFVGFGSAVGTYPAVDPNMVLYYHFNNGTGENYTFVKDFSTNSNNATCNPSTCPTFNSTGGFLGDGDFSYNGINNTFIANKTLFNLTSVREFTVMAWIKKTGSISSDDGDILTSYIPSAGQRNLAFRLNNNRTSIGIQTIDNVDCASVGSTELNIGTWYHIVGRWNGTFLTTFVNGIEDTSTPTTCLNSSYSDIPKIEIGKARPSFYWNGSIDEIILFNKSLVNSEIWNIYNQYNGCFIPIEDLQIGGNSSLCTGTYYSNDTAQDGFIKIVANNTILNLNNSFLIGNNSGSSLPNIKGIVVDGTNNTVIKNGNIYYFRNGISCSGCNNLNISNNTFLGGRNSYVITGLAGNIFIENNNFTNISFYSYSDNTNNIFIYENKFYLTSLLLSDKGSPLVNNAWIFKNSFNLNSGSAKYHLHLGNVSNVYVYNNTFTNSSNGFGNIQLRFAANVTINNNNFNINDRAIQLSEKGSNITISYNNFNNSWTFEDFYAATIVSQGNRTVSSGIDNWTNINIFNNNFNNFGCSGLLLRDVFDLNVFNNNFFQDINFLKTLEYNCYNEPFSAIFIHEAYKGFIPSGSQSSDNITIASIHRSGNINIINNTFTNINILLRTQGTTNVQTDFNNYWYRSYQNIYSLDKEDYWISQDWNNLTILFNSSVTGRGGVLSNMFYSTAAFSNPVFNVSINKDYEYYLRINISNGNQLNLYNKTSALIYFSNGSVACSNINSCNGNINITLSPNNYSFVLDNYNKTEGVVRSNDPITLTSSSYTSKTYTSTISNISNVSVSFIVASCDSVGDISTSSQSWETGSYDCENYYVTLTNANLQNGDTQFTIEYNQATDELCVNFAGASDSFFSFVMVFIIVGVLGFLVFLFGFSNEEIDLNILAFMILAAFLIMLFGYQIISNIGGC